MITRNYFGGYTIVTSDVFTERRQFRFPRTKKRRIRAKWAKRPENWKTVPSPTLYFDEKRSALHCHPETWAKMEKAIERLRSFSPTQMVDSDRILMDSLVRKPLPSIEKIKRQAALLQEMMTRRSYVASPESSNFVSDILGYGIRTTRDMIIPTFTRPKIDPPEGEAEVVAPLSSLYPKERMSPLEFMEAYGGQFFSSPEERKALRLWCCYHVICECFNRTVCTGGVHNGMAMPRNGVEDSTVNRHAYKVRRAVSEVARAERIADHTLDSAWREAELLSDDERARIVAGEKDMMAAVREMMAILYPPPPRAPRFDF